MSATPTTIIPRGHTACPCCGGPVPVVHIGLVISPIRACPSCDAPVSSFWILSALLAVMAVVTTAVALATGTMDLMALLSGMGVMIILLETIRWWPSRMLRQRSREAHQVRQIAARRVAVADLQRMRNTYVRFCPHAEWKRIDAWIAAHYPY